jgi:hypothetical protein
VKKIFTRKKSQKTEEKTTMKLSVLTVTVVAVALGVADATFGSDACPAPCSCSASGAVVDCSRRALRHIPQNLPKNTVTL